MSSESTKKPDFFNNSNPTFLYVFLAIYIAAIFFGVTNHEQWRDEAQTWLLTRDLSLTDLLKTLPTEGHPPLWYLLVMPMAKLGLPYASQNWLAAFVMSVAVYLLFFKTKLPVFIKILLPFSYFFLFEYALFGRSYCLIVFFLSCIISIYPKRFDKPWLYALCLIGLYNTHVLVFAFATALWILYIIDAKKEGRLNKQIMLPWIVAGFGGLYLLPYLAFHPITSAFLIRMKKSPFVYMSRAFEHSMLIRGNKIVAAVLFLALLSGLVKHRLLFVTVLAGISGLLYILMFKYVGGDRHEGILLLFLLTTYALCAIQDNSHNKLYKGGLIVFAVVLLIQHVPGLRNYNDDKNEIYSDAQGVAEFIKESGFEHKLLVGHQASVACAILPFLPEVDSMYHGECERFGTYYNYGACLLNNTVVVQPDYAIDLVYKKFKSRMHDAIFIFNYPIQPENRQYMDLIYLTPYPVLRQDESFWIYKFKDNAN